MFRNFFAFLQTKTHLLWAFVSRKKRKMAELISLNVLVVPRETTVVPRESTESITEENITEENITEENIIVLEISPKRSVYQLKPLIKEHLHISFKEVEPTGIFLWKSDGVWQSFSDQFHQFRGRKFPGCKRIYPHELISKHFPTQPSNDNIHVIVTIE
jgi:hypothetical protein